jgi:hypothetical protein
MDAGSIPAWRLGEGPTTSQPIIPDQIRYPASTPGL